MDNIDLSFDGVIFCDDIRQENSGKYLIIGAYGGTILLEKYPATLGVACLVQVSPGVTGVVPFEFRMTGPHGAMYGAIGGTFEAPDVLTQHVLALPVVQVTINLSGHINLEYRHPGGEWCVVRRLEALTRAEFEERVAKTQQPAS